MTFDEFEKADEHKLREKAKACFDEANKFGSSWGGKAPLLLEAQFYMMELDRKHDAKITRRSFRLELIIIFLIGLELVVAVWGIRLGIKESNEQTDTMQRLIHALDKIIEGH